MSCMADLALAAPHASLSIGRNVQKNRARRPWIVIITETSTGLPVLPTCQCQWSHASVEVVDHFHGI